MNDKAALWDQVRDGGYVDCVISLGVDGVQDDTWGDRPLLITSASINFVRKPILEKPASQQAPRKSLFSRR